MQDIIPIIYSYSNIDSYFSLSIINKEFNRCSRIDSIWKSLFTTNFYTCFLPKEFTSWYTFYTHVHACYKACEVEATVHYLDNEGITSQEQISQYIDVTKLQVNDLVKVQQLLPSVTKNVDLSLVMDTTNDFPGFFIVTKNKTLNNFTYYDITDSEYIISVPIRFWRNVMIEASLPSFGSHILDKWKAELETNAKWNGKTTHTWFIHNYVKYEITSQSKEIDWVGGSYMLFHCGDESGYYPLKYRSYVLYTY